MDAAERAADAYGEFVARLHEGPRFAVFNVVVYTAIRAAERAERERAVRIVQEVCATVADDHAPMLQHIIQLIRAQESPE